MAALSPSPVEVGQTYLQLHHQVHRLVDQAMCGAGLSLARAKVLMRLNEHGPMNQAKLAGLLKHAPRSVTDTIDALERDGLVKRSEDENDRRARILELTPSGREAFETSQTVWNKAMDEIFGSLTAGERVQLAALLNTIGTNLIPGDKPCG
jgi:DNA-binding MarR family transcriptional regulator